MDSKYIDIIYKELSARMTYGLKVQCDDRFLFTFDEKHMGIGMLYTDYYGQPTDTPKIILSGCFYGNDIKPYLYPLSSMTDGQKRNLTSLFNCHVEITQYEIKFTNYQDSNMDNWNKVFNWCYKNHFDINGLIPMGLAIDATGLGIYE